MFEKTKPARDAFAFSLGGVTAVTPFVAVPVVADDRFKKVPVKRESKLRPWLGFYDQAAYYPCS